MDKQKMLEYYEEWMETTPYLRFRKYCEDMIFAIKYDCMPLVNRKWNNAYRNLEDTCDANKKLKKLKAEVKFLKL